MDFHECPWISTDFHECPWISMKKQAPLFYPSHFSVPAPKNKHLCSPPATFQSRHPKTSTFVLPQPLFGPGTQKQAPLFYPGHFSVPAPKNKHLSRERSYSDWGEVLFRGGKDSYGPASPRLKQDCCFSQVASPRLKQDCCFSQVASPRLKQDCLLQGMVRGW